MINKRRKRKITMDKTVVSYGKIRRSNCNSRETSDKIGKSNGSTGEENSRGFT